MENIRVTVRIKGRVQGVFFRQSARERALSLKLTGWVRNLPDGDVEAVFEGSKQGIKEILIWCKQGPSSARVDNLQVSHEESTDEFSTFSIK